MIRIIKILLLLTPISLLADVYVLAPKEIDGKLVLLEGYLYPSGKFSSFGRVWDGAHSVSAFQQYAGKYLVYEGQWISDYQGWNSFDYAVSEEVLKIDDADFLEIEASGEPSGKKLVLDLPGWIYSYGDGIYYFQNSEVFFELHRYGDMVWYFEYGGEYWSQVSER